MFTTLPELTSSEQLLSKTQEWTKLRVQYEYFSCDWRVLHDLKCFQVATHFVVYFLFPLFTLNASSLPSGFSELTRYYT